MCSVRSARARCVVRTGPRGGSKPCKCCGVVGRVSVKIPCYRPMLLTGRGGGQLRH